MKNIFIFILVLLMPVSGLIAQNNFICGKSTNGISTNPDSPTNPLCPDKLNTFDWRTDKYYDPFYLESESDTTLPSPFYNSGNGAITEIWNTNVYDGKDFEVEDGWELVVDGMTKIQGNQESSQIAYFVLYNKFTAILRVFGVHFDIKDNDYVIVNLEFDPITKKHLACCILQCRLHSRLIKSQ